MIQVFDVVEGKNTKSVPSKKYGVHLARFTHHSRQILHASTKVDGTATLSRGLTERGMLNRPRFLTLA